MHDVKRDEQMRQWIAAGTDDILEYEGVVMWGVSFNLDDESEAPEALFSTEEKADAYAALFDRQEWHVGPYVLSCKTRNSTEVPEMWPNVCEHGDHPAPAGQRFCSMGCQECDGTDLPDGKDGCANVCGLDDAAPPETRTPTGESSAS